MDLHAVFYSRRIGNRCYPLFRHIFDIYSQIEKDRKDYTCQYQTNWINRNGIKTRLLVHPYIQENNNILLIRHMFVPAPQAMSRMLYGCTCPIQIRKSEVCPFNPNRARRPVSLVSVMMMMNMIQHYAGEGGTDHGKNNETIIIQ